MNMGRPYGQRRATEFREEKDATLFVLDGTLFAEGRQVWWNFVASTPDKIEAAQVRWSDEKYGAIGESS